jgi:hypothetical protein
MTRHKIIVLIAAISLYSIDIYAQDQDLLKLVDSSKPKKEFVRNAFKSSRVINNHSMEFIGKGVMDVRFLHRFGLVNSGFENFFGLDEATMRFGFDYGITKDVTVGFGRSTVGKEWDGFLKLRPVAQSKGPRSVPFSVVVVSGVTISSLPWADPDRKNYFSSRMCYYNEVIIGRKFTEVLSLQVSPTLVHRNLVPLESDKNDVFAVGLGGRVKFSKHVAFVVDYDYVVSGLTSGTYANPLSMGVDIETGGHVFQLHFSNSTGMNEKAFITETTDKWKNGDIRFGFNLSRVFTINKPKKNTSNAKW